MITAVGICAGHGPAGSLTHSVVRVASLDEFATAIARHGTPLTSDDLMTLDGGIPAALVSGPDGHRFLVEERAVPTPWGAPGPANTPEHKS
jgi:hypothetical protein